MHLGIVILTHFQAKNLFEKSLVSRPPLLLFKMDYVGGSSLCKNGSGFINNINAITSIVQNPTISAILIHAVLSHVQLGRSRREVKTF